MLDWGQTLDSHTMETGLRDLNPDLHFDMGGKLNLWHPMQDTRQGVFYHGRHICSMDRGVVPEFKVWSVAERVARVPLNESEIGDASIQYISVHPSTPGYEDMYRDAQSGSRQNLTILEDGRLVSIWAVRTTKVRDRVVRVGWRHTFERLIMASVPQVTREALARKFNVDMWKLPLGSPEETYAQLMEE